MVRRKNARRGYGSLGEQVARYQIPDPAPWRRGPLRHRAQGRRPALPYRFATERSLSINTAAQGGNAALMALEEG